jgi:hypothetical protein
MVRKSLSILMILFVLLVSACAAPTTGTEGNTNTGVDNTNAGNTNTGVDNTNAGNTNTGIDNTNTGVDNTNTGGVGNDNTNSGAAATPAAPAGTGLSPDQQQALVDNVTAWLAQQLGVDVTAIQVVSITPTTFSDTCLGLGGPAESCAQVTVPGVVIVFSANGQTYVVNASLDGASIRLDDTAGGVLDTNSNTNASPDTNANENANTNGNSNTSP